MLEAYPSSLTFRLSKMSSLICVRICSINVLDNNTLVASRFAKSQKCFVCGFSLAKFCFPGLWYHLHGRDWSECLQLSRSRLDIKAPKTRAFRSQDSNTKDSRLQNMSFPVPFLVLRGNMLPHNAMVDLEASRCDRLDTSTEDETYAIGPSYNGEAKTSRHESV